MYIALTGSENNKDVYIYHSFRKENGKSSSRIYKKLGKYNTLLEQFDGDRDKMMAWAREQADKETKLYKEAVARFRMLFIEYYGAAEPPVRCGESHLSGLTEPLHFVY